MYDQTRHMHVSHVLHFCKIYNGMLFFLFSECINPLFKKDTPKDDHIDSGQPESK